MSLSKNKKFLKIISAQFLSNFGTTVSTFAFAFYLLHLFPTQPTYMTVAELMYSLPTLFVFLFVGVLADKLDRQKILTYSNWIRAGLTVLLYIFIYLNWIIPCFLILFIRSGVSKFNIPAEVGLLQGSLDKNQFTQAAGVSQSIMGIFMLFGMGIGAALYKFLGIQGVVILDGIAMIVSGLLIHAARFPSKVRQPNGVFKITNISFKEVLKDFSEGAVYIKNHPLLLSIIVVYFVFGIVNGSFAVLPIYTMKYKFQFENYETYSSILMIILGAGFLVGSVTAAPIIKKFSRITVMNTCCLLSGLLLLIGGLSYNLWLLYGVVLVTGYLICVSNVCMMSWISVIVEPAKIGRVNAWTEPLKLIGHSLALGMIAILFPRYVGVNFLYGIISVCLLIIGVYYLIVLPKINRKYEMDTTQSCNL